MRKHFENILVAFLRGSISTEPKPPRQLSIVNRDRCRSQAEARVPPDQRGNRFAGRQSKRSNLVYTQPSHSQLVDSINRQQREEAKSPFEPMFIIRRAEDQDSEAPERHHRQRP